MKMTMDSKLKFANWMLTMNFMAENAPRKNEDPGSSKQSSGSITYKYVYKYLHTSSSFAPHLQISPNTYENKTVLLGPRRQCHKHLWLKLTRETCQVSTSTLVSSVSVSKLYRNTCQIALVEHDFHHQIQSKMFLLNRVNENSSGYF